MLPAANPIGAAVKPPQSATSHTATRTETPQTGAARTSTGETGAANVRADTADAVKAPEQTAVAPRLRDQETAENTPERDAPTGPPPSFEESPLERQARVALDPPEAEDTLPEDPAEATTERAERQPDDARREARSEPPPTRTERAEVSFAETQAISEPKEPAKVDVAR